MRLDGEGNQIRLEFYGRFPEPCLAAVCVMLPRLAERGAAPGRCRGAGTAAAPDRGWEEQSEEAVGWMEGLWEGESGAWGHEEGGRGVAGCAALGVLASPGG